MTLRSWALAVAMIGSGLAACTPEPEAPVHADFLLSDIVWGQIAGRRMDAGLDYLDYSLKLSLAADQNAVLVNETDISDGDQPTPASLTERVTNAGYAWCSVAESVAEVEVFSDESLGAWMTSDADKAIILNPDFQEFGFAASGDTWVVIFAKPC